MIVNLISSKIMNRDCFENISFNWLVQITSFSKKKHFQKKNRFLSNPIYGSKLEKEKQLIPLTTPQWVNLSIKEIMTIHCGELDGKCILTGLNATRRDLDEPIAFSYEPNSDVQVTKGALDKGDVRTIHYVGHLRCNYYDEQKTITSTEKRQMTWSCITANKWFWVNDPDRLSSSVTEIDRLFEKKHELDNYISQSDGQSPEQTHSLLE